MKIKVGNRFIGTGEPPYIILEIARTYDNDIEKAAKMIKIAAQCGANAVKIQSINPEGLMVYNDHTKNYYNKLKKLRRTEKEHKYLLKIAKKHGIEFLSTPESFDMANLLDKIGVNAYKISSLDCVYYDFLKHIAKKGKPIFLSTGMANEEEIKKAIKTIKNEGNDKIVLLHCISLYPPKIEELNLGMINIINEKFDVIPGFSDHTPDIKASLCAITLGAKVIEKHFKIDNGIGSEWKGDYDTSITPEQVRELVKYARSIKKIPKKFVTDKEIERRQTRGRKIVAKKNLRSGERITNKDLICKQNLKNIGIDCSRLDKIIGRKLKRNINKDNVINFEDIRK